ncbi:adenosylcobinamide kinase /adenosylcobinamide-phosphate guanylyltransferase [Arboricoccus pini]|uniref:Bifunctional adenosylcobalamin biosynthesis protein n=1 Tax=Arboricoccus pini TaxID=1963835 RepID=A0A212QNR1_9PROT|nr:bifunctional adenosylcobinamide kinase/adenosylcobinamide-phosphate guanylyltransferase [Arboricoccus pini]SNB60866.1 adenosylcobinamide kinase /adenosylcobinamide-phosphate guanylyltransferase [Arboricoccus pini]
MTRLGLVLGGARSGKSRFAEEQVLASGLQPIYIATAEAWDEQMRERIAHHKANRQGKGWQTLEEPTALDSVISSVARADRFLLVDCLTLWLTNLMMADRDIDIAVEKLLDVVVAQPGKLLFVSNEVGLGGVATTPLGRSFADHAGRLHQRLAEVADEVVLMVAGLSLWLKRSPES